MLRSCVPLAVAAALGICSKSVAGETAPRTLADLYETVSSSIVLVTNGLKEYDSFGSGVVLHEDGYIATAAHVVADADEIGIRFTNGDETQATIVTFSRSQDLALLKVPKLPEGTYIAPLCDSDQVKPGQQVFCIGAPRGLQFSISSGIVSAVRRNVGNRYKIFSPVDVIQTDAAVNPGNSGGALFTMDGQVAGIAVQIISDTQDFAGVGLAVPANLVRSRLFADALPFIGVHLQRIQPELASALNWPPIECLLVERVVAGSAAEKAGLRGGRYLGRVAEIQLVFGGDVIYEVGGIPVRDSAKVHAYLKNLEAGDTIEYVLYREGKIERLEIPVEEFEPIPQLPDPGAPAKAAPAADESVDEPPSLKKAG